MQLVGGCAGADTLRFSWKAEPCQPGDPENDYDVLNISYLLEIIRKVL